MTKCGDTEAGKPRTFKMVVGGMGEQPYRSLCPCHHFSNIIVQCHVRCNVARVENYAIYIQVYPSFFVKYCEQFNGELHIANDWCHDLKQFQALHSYSDN